MRGHSNMRIDYEKFIPSSSICQKIFFSIICIAIAIIYFPSLFHIPRADQLWYLLDTVNTNDFFSLVKNFYSYNRSRLYSCGDFLAFRPILFIFLGFEKWVFGNNFMLSQAVGIILHLILGWRLFKILNFINPGRISFVFVMFFSLLAAIMDLVCWTHLNSYIIFMIFILIAAYHLLIYTQNPYRKNELLIITACLFIACFTYELGIVYALTFFIYSLCVSQNKKPAGWFNRKYLLLLAPIAAYLIINVLDYFSRSQYLSKFNGQQGDWAALKQIINFSNFNHKISLFFELLGKWFMFGLLPAIFRIFPGPRFGLVQLLNFNDIGNIRIDMSCNIIAVLTLLAYSLRCISLKVITQRKKIVVLFSVMLIEYIGLIVIARTIERGVEDVFQRCTYYSYFFWVFVTIIFYSLIDSEILKKYLRSWHKYPIIICYLFFLWINASIVYEVNFKFAKALKSKRQFISQTNDFINAHRREADFSFKIYSHPQEDELISFTKLGVWDKFYLSSILFGNYINEQQPKYMLMYKTKTE